MQASSSKNPLEIIQKALLAHASQSALQSQDLPVFLKHLTDFLKATLQPRGWGYILAGGETSRYALGENLEDISTSNPAQPFLLAIAISAVLSQKKPAVLPVAAEKDVQARAINPTNYLHCLMPLIAKNQAIGVMHFWFEPSQNELDAMRAEVLYFASKQLDLFLNTQGAVELAQEAGKLSSYIHLLEELSGDQDIQTIGWNLVNYAREALECSRVSLFSLKGYTIPDPHHELGPIYKRTFQIRACSGLRRTHPRSEHAVILANLSKALLKVGLTSSETNITNQSVDLALRNPTQLPLAFAPRDPNRRAKRTAAINDYFERMPMNWACALPLTDEKGHVCGIVLFEGQHPLKNPPLAFHRMRSLALSAGKTVAVALEWEQKKTFKWSYIYHRWIANLTPGKKKILTEKISISAVMLAVALLFPLPYRIRGTASLMPTQQVALTAPTLAKLETISVKIGDEVKSGQVLAQMGTMRLDLALKELDRQLAIANTAADKGLSSLNEAQIIQSLGQADQIAAQIQTTEHKKEQTTLRAPFDGTIIGPQEINQKLGDIFQTGAVVLEIANLEHWNVRAEVREQDFAYLQKRLKEGHGPIKTNLSLLADPNNDYELELSQLSQLGYAVDSARDNYSYYVNFHLTVTSSTGDQLRSNYLGDAKIYSGWKPIYFILFHDFANFLAVRM
jgi:multidrug efflux pump subunit AcrA (membrane-fusion protein)